MPARRLAHVLLLSLALALSAWRCSGASRSPVAPTVPATGAALAGANVVNWACFAGSGAGAFGSELCGARGPSVVGTQRIGASILDAPTGLTQSVSGTTVTLTWQTAPGGDPPTSYVIEAGSSSGRSDLANFDSNSLQTTLTVTSVPAGVYYVRVRARNSSGVGPVSNEVVVNVGGGSCLAAPAAPTALNAAVSGSSVTLDWAAPAGGCPVLTYRIEAGSAPGGSNLAIVVTGTTATTFSASNVGPGTYYVRVRAQNNSGTSAPSGEVAVTVGTKGTPIVTIVAYPILAGASDTSTHGITLSIDNAPVTTTGTFTGTLAPHPQFEGPLTAGTHQLVATMASWDSLMIVVGSTAAGNAGSVDATSFQMVANSWTTTPFSTAVACSSRVLFFGRASGSIAIRFNVVLGIAASACPAPRL